MAVLRYTLLRALVFAVVAALLWLVGLRGLVLVALGLVLSGVLSFFVLRGSRDQVSIAWDRRLRTIRERTAAEDAWDDEQRAQAERSRSDAEAPRASRPDGPREA
ncbi:DUF4229 domain-containing protein [Jiangella aurantiaca]|uniref:DUF4229 domain-containing protein n=1 Tax=Jiangella aurantiaca TaxID=2530373 RepID=A0A4R5ACL3_9ACTN|nr:DUF4229 domain-containing protein [Jiangella aurantiaca]TDD69435.1 DUF4229 domain-containing protein [Jiangella aurantiaca]